MSDNEKTLFAFGIYLICAWAVYFCIKAFKEIEEEDDFIVAVLWPMAVVMPPLVWFFRLAAKLAKKFRGQS